MADDNKLLHEEETCKTDNSALLYTMSTILHIQILLHATQLEPAEPFLAAHLEPFHAAYLEPFRATQPEPFLAAHLEPFRAAQPEPFLAVHLEPKTQNPKPSRAVQSRTQTFLAPRPPERFRL